MRTKWLLVSGALAALNALQLLWHGVHPDLVPRAPAGEVPATAAVTPPALVEAEGAALRLRVAALTARLASARCPPDEPVQPVVPAAGAAPSGRASSAAATEFDGYFDDVFAASVAQGRNPAAAPTERYLRDLIASSRLPVADGPDAIICGTDTCRVDLRLDRPASPGALQTLLTRSADRLPQAVVETAPGADHVVVVLAPATTDLAGATSGGGE